MFQYWVDFVWFQMQRQMSDLLRNIFPFTATKFYRMQKHIHCKMFLNSKFWIVSQKKLRCLPWWHCAGDRSKPPQSPESKWVLSIWSRACLEVGGKEGKGKKIHMKPQNMKCCSDARPQSARAADATISLRPEEAFHVRGLNNKNINYTWTLYELAVLQLKQGLKGVQCLEQL